MIKEKVSPLNMLITNIALSIFSLLALAHLFLGLWWLAGWWFFILVVFLVLVSKQPLFIAFRKRSLLAYPLLFLSLFIIVTGLKVLFFGMFFVPTSSMERTILPGDIIWGNKLSYGPSLPESPYEIPGVNLFVWMIEGSRADLERRWWEPRRLKGYRKATPGEILMFEDPVKKDVLLKRCMGIPGDTIRIINGKVYINNDLHHETKDLLLYSRVTVNNRRDALEGLDRLGVHHFSFYSHGQDTSHISLYLTQEEIERVFLLPGVTHIAIEKVRPDTAWRVYPSHDNFNWTIDDYGPIVIPEKGMKMELTRESWILYGKLVNRFEKAGIEYSKGQFFMEGDLITEYTFEKSYYFMLGDNRHDSRDSRYIGLIPEDKIICRATMILFSKNKSGPKFSRTFKNLRNR
ncbi:MAG: signal peptidase I [Candidatus Paceibacterota bacterium]